MTVTSSFSVTGWEPASTETPDEGPSLSRIVIRKTFEGGLVGESAGEGLFCGMDDPASGAGYVVSERFTGRIGDREGSFVIHHGGHMGPGVAPHTFGSVVPGSGTGALRGLAGTVEIDQADGAHTLTLEMDLPPEA